MVLSEHSVRTLVTLCPSGSAVDADRLRPGHFQAFLGKKSAEAGARLLFSHPELHPIQLGYLNKGRCEVVAHAARHYLTYPPPNRVCLKIDMRNTFNCLRRDLFLSEA